MALMPLHLTFGALRRGRRVVLDAASVSLPAGRGVGVIGLNGAGKTTLLMALAGLLRNSNLKLNGLPVSEITVGYASQNAPLPAWATVRDVFALFGTSLAAAQSACAGLRLEELLGLAVRELTPGQKQALVAVATLMLGADVLVLDEPFAGLDFHRAGALRAALAEAAADRTVIISAQSITDLLEICDRFIVLRGGRVTFSGHLHDLRLSETSQPADVERVMVDLVLGPQLEVSAER